MTRTLCVKLHTRWKSIDRHFGIIRKLHSQDITSEGGGDASAAAPRGDRGSWKALQYYRVLHRRQHVGVPPAFRREILAAPALLPLGIARGKLVCGAASIPLRGLLSLGYCCGRKSRQVSAHRVAPASVTPLADHGARNHKRGRPSYNAEALPYKSEILTTLYRCQ